MVDISSQNNKINITVSSSGNTANTNVTPDYAQYYSEKSKEWAISNRIVDNIDYSSKYYANESKKQADISTAKATEVVESGNTAVSNIESARDNAITDITNQESLSVDNVNTAGATQIALATEQANIATEQATIATNKASEVIVSGNNALSNIDTAKNNAITSITNQETISKTNLIEEGATQVGLIQNEGATQVANVQSTGFYMRDDKLYYINSQGQETEFKLDDIELNNPYSLFDSKYSDHELNNLSWLKSEGQWNAKTVYTDAYDELLTEYNNSASTTETEGSITFKRTPKGYKIALADQETAIDTKYSTDGIAWYYILDTANTQFKLPRTKFGFEGLRTNVGDDIAESLPNITGNATPVIWINQTTSSGVFNQVGPGSVAGVTAGSSLGTGVLDFNASRSSSTYKDGAPVQERATQMYLYFYVGETVQNANLIDAGRIGEQLAGKADIESLATKADISTPSIQAPYIKDTYVNGTSGYIVWSNGYCEQWEEPKQAGRTTYYRTFLKTFRTPPHLSVSPHMNSSSGIQYRHFGYNITTTGFESYTGTATDIISWKACGYLAAGQY